LALRYRHHAWRLEAGAGTTGRHTCTSRAGFRSRTIVRDGQHRSHAQRVADAAVLDRPDPAAL